MRRNAYEIATSSLNDVNTIELCSLLVAIMGGESLYEEVLGGGMTYDYLVGEDVGCVDYEYHIGAEEEMVHLGEGHCEFTYHGGVGSFYVEIYDGDESLPGDDQKLREFLLDCGITVLSNVLEKDPWTQHRDLIRSTLDKLRKYPEKLEQHMEDLYDQVTGLFARFEQLIEDSDIDLSRWYEDESYKTGVDNQIYSVTSEYNRFMREYEQQRVNRRDVALFKKDVEEFERQTRGMRKRIAQKRVGREFYKQATGKRYRGNHGSHRGTQGSRDSLGSKKPLTHNPFANAFKKKD